MEVKLERLNEKCEIRFVAEVSGEEWKKAQQNAIVALAQNVTVKGFRKGKAPLAQASKYINPRDVLDRAADKFVQKAYKEMLDNHDVKPIVQPELIVNDFSAEKFSCTFVVATAPSVELGEYKGITVEKKAVRVYKADIEKELEAMAEKNAELVVVEEDVAAELGNTVVIDFKGFVDGEAFDGGEASSFELVLGSNTFVPGFEEQLIGVKTNEDREVTITFPENYVANLSNKEAKFEVHVNAIKKKVVPAIDDEFVADLDIEGVETVEQLKENVKEQLRTRKTNAQAQERYDALVEQIMGNAKFFCNTKFLQADADKIVKDFENRLEQQGFSLDDYLVMSKKTKEDINKEALEQAHKNAKNAYVMDAIANAEKIVVTPADVDAKLAEFAEQYKTTVEELKKQLGNNINNFAYNVRQERVVAFLKENNNN